VLAHHRGLVKSSGFPLATDAFALFDPDYLIGKSFAGKLLYEFAPLFRLERQRGGNRTAMSRRENVRAMRWRARSSSMHDLLIFVPLLLQISEVRFLPLTESFAN